MLGTFRFLLAGFVVMYHIGTFPSAFGLYAVQGFYVVSGFLMTSVLNEAYKDRSTAFWSNRFLRLFPQYYIVAAVTLVIILLVPEADRFHSAWGLDSDPSFLSIISQLTIVPFALAENSTRLVPQTWSVGVEIINYFLLWLFMAHSGRRAALAFVASALVHIYFLAGSIDVLPRYSPWYSAVLPFSVGALTYFWSRKTAVGDTVTIVAFCLWLLNFAAAVWFPNGIWFSVVFWYANIVLSAPVIAGVAMTRRVKWDKAIGDLAYPIFLCHWIVGFCVSWATGILHSPQLLALAAVPILIVSAILAFGADAIVEPIRSRVRSSDGGRNLTLDAASSPIPS